MGQGEGTGEGRGVASTCLHPVLLQMCLSFISQLCKLVTDPPQALLKADTNSSAKFRMHSLALNVTCAVRTVTSMSLPDTM